jgi:hypothetical protein
MINQEAGMVADLQTEGTDHRRFRWGRNKPLGLALEMMIMMTTMRKGKSRHDFKYLQSNGCTHIRVWIKIILIFCIKDNRRQKQHKWE